jgi:hypothetical protein
MRYFLRGDQATRVLPSTSGYKTKFQKRGAIIQVLGAGTAWFARERSILENADSAGIPSGGNSLTSANGPYEFQEWNDDMWMRGSVTGVAVEVNDFTVR